MTKINGIPAELLAPTPAPKENHADRQKFDPTPGSASEGIDALNRLNLSASSNKQIALQLIAEARRSICLLEQHLQHGSVSVDDLNLLEALATSAGMASRFIPNDRPEAKLPDIGKAKADIPPFLRNRSPRAWEDPATVPLAGQPAPTRWGGGEYVGSID